MAEEVNYILDDVATTPVPADEIDSTFRSSCIGEQWHFSEFLIFCVLEIRVKEGHKVEPLQETTAARNSSRSHERKIGIMAPGWELWV